MLVRIAYLKYNVWRTSYHQDAELLNNKHLVIMVVKLRVEYQST